MPDAKVRVRLDTKQAKAELRGLNKMAQGTAGSIGGGLRRGLGAVGLGAVGGAAAGMVRGGVGGGVTDILGGALTPLISRLQSMLFQGKDLEASATKQAFAQFGPATFERWKREGEPRQSDIDVFKFRRDRARRQLEGKRIGEQFEPFMTSGGKKMNELVNTDITAAQAKAAATAGMVGGFGSFARGAERAWDWIVQQLRGGNR